MNQHVTAHDASAVPTATDSKNELSPGDLESVSTCPVCGCDQRTLLYEGLTDVVFNAAPGRWSLFRCAGCESGYLDPRLSPVGLSKAYTSYYTHSSADQPWV